MLHLITGQVGHFLVVLSFVAVIVSSFGYYKSFTSPLESSQKDWLVFSRYWFGIHTFGVIGVVCTLFWIIYNHYYEYHYAWSHSSNNLPVHYMISCFWEGQEGSFLLWAFWHTLIAWVIIKANRKWESGVMTFFSAVQVFLISMILGVVILGLNIKIGSSPFALLRDASEAPIFQMNPDYVPQDGTGLNPLLQNYWMVIHPPTLFLGFALTLVPFAFCIAALWKKRPADWIEEALPWAHIAAFVLGAGIMMGAYWAYETLNFGGYWNWDPVENAVYIPWLVLVAGIHLMIISKRKKSALKAAIILIITSFLLILYSTFLTRSGILGESSVHSFTDLGLSGQLILYLGFFVIVSIWLLAINWKKLKGDEQESNYLQGEFWIYLGTTTLCLAAFQVLIPTSIPVFNAILKGIGIPSNLAPPAEQVTFYTKFQLWFGVAIAILSGLGQFFFWKKQSISSFKEAISAPLILTLVLSASIIYSAKISDPSYIVLLLSATFTMMANATTIIRLAKLKKAITMGGSITHFGLGLMLFGILFSAGYSKVVSLNMTGLLYNREFSEDMNRENLLLFRNQAERMSEYALTFKGTKKESRDIPGYIDEASLLYFSDPHKAIAKKDLVHKGQTYATSGDTIHLYEENTYYEIEFAKEGKEAFTLYPRLQTNPQMGIVPSPDITSFPTKDLYAHITSISDPEAEQKWSEPHKETLSVGDTFFLNDFVAVLDGVNKVESIPGLHLGNADLAVIANIRAFSQHKDYDLKPYFVIQGKQVGLVPHVEPDLGVKITFDKIDPTTETFEFSVSTTQKDWIILKALEKPFINILWLGTLLVLVGFCVATIRRLKG